MLTALTGVYLALLEKHFKPRLTRTDLIPILARFAAVASIAVALALILSLRMVIGT